MNPIHIFDVSPSEQPLFSPHIQALPASAKVVFHPNAAQVEADAVVISPFVNSQVTAEMMAAMPHLQLIACRSTGFDNIDVQAARKLGVAVCSVPSYGDSTVAEYGFALILNLTRKISQAVAQLEAQRSDRDQLRGTDLRGKTLGLLGAGRIGCRMASIARGFGMTVLAFDAYPDSARAAEYGFSYASRAEVVAAADILSLHMPATPETHHLIDASIFSAMKPTAILLNTARGEIVNTTELIEALAAGHIAGAALDVYEGEGRATAELESLQRLPQVIITNHNAYNTIEAVGRINEVTLANITSFLAGQPRNLIAE